jgi:rhodanese-related sulfurtransferase
MKSIASSLFLVAFAVVACQAESTPIGSISPVEFSSRPPENAIVLDVRSTDEFNGGHISEAINIPHDELALRLAELDGTQDRPVVVYCERGGRAAKAAAVLETAGYSDILYLEGHMKAWREAGRPLSTGSNQPRTIQR